MEKKRVVIGFQEVDLEPWEFIFGREKCSRETNVSEQTLRTSIKFLQAKGVLEKVTSKSTNKFTVYKWIKEAFYDGANQEKNPKATIEEPTSHHKQEKKKKEKKKQLAESKVNENKKEEVFLRGGHGKFSQNELQNIITLMFKRAKKGEILNPQGWLAKCLKEGWHKEESMLNASENLTSDKEKIEINRKLAWEYAKKGKHCYFSIKQDFIEIGKSRQNCVQIFFWETESDFASKLKFMLKKLESKTN